MLERLAQRWNQMPRAGRWMVVFLAAMGAYFGLIDPMLQSGNSKRVLSELRRDELRTLQDQAGTIKIAESTIALGVAHFGDVRTPEPESGRDAAVSERIRAILADRGVQDSRISQQRPVELKGERVQRMVGSDEFTLQRVVFSVEVTDEAATVMGVLADIERLPGVAAIGEATIRRVSRDEDRVQLVCSPEVWLVRPKSQGGRR